MSASPPAGLADLVRQHSPAIAAEVTEAFLDRHPDWRLRYGARATTAGVQDAGYHLAFLAAAVDLGQPEAFADYARWAGRVLAARNIPTPFLAENIAQLRDALGPRIGPRRAARLAPYFACALDTLQQTPESALDHGLSLAGSVFLQAILGGQRHAAVQVAREALRGGLTLEQLYLDVFQPALYAVGARWEANRLTVAQEHVATAITQYVMAQVYEAPDTRDAGRGTVVITGVEGELHNVGAVMVGDLLELSGWRVRFLGTNLPAASILDVIRQSEPAHVGISATMLFNTWAVRHLVDAIRTEFGGRTATLVGGAAFRSTPGLWRQVEADAYAPDLRGVQAILQGAH